MNRNAGLTAGIVALLALVARVALPTGSEQTSTAQAGSGGKATQAQSAKASATPQPYEGPWLATRHFFAAPEQPPSSAPIDFSSTEDILRCTGDPQCVPRLRQYFGLPKTDGVECLLATVPDPFHTRLALFTDHSIEAIGKAAAWTQWEFATQWLPWKDTVDPAEVDPAKRALDRSYIRAQEIQPGVLVFRHEAPETLLVFLVGETPTAGVNPDQFQIARAYMQALGDPPVHPDQVRIVGPTFSGSFHSLAELIVQDRARYLGKHYQVRSGTAQSQDAERAFMDRAGPRVRFHSATEDLWQQDGHFRDVLDELRISPDRAAVLAEDQSTFGNAAASASSHVDLPVRTASPAGAREEIRVFRFPRDISHLRDAYRQVLQTSKTDKAPVTSLSFSLKDPSVGEDSVPTYSQAQTPLSQNSVINEIIRTIRRDNIRMVEVSATNVLDLLFLAGVLRRQCPDTRLLFQSADLLFVQAEQTQPLDGTLFLTSYPLFAESKLWQEPKHGRKEIDVFPDTLSEGTFNATVLLLADWDQRRKLVSDYAWQAVSYPPAWLLTLDRRGFTPVRMWPNYDTSDWFQPVHRGHGNPDLTRVTAPSTWKILSSAIALIGVALSIFMLRLHSKEDWIVDARMAPPESGDLWRGFYLFLFLLILIGIQIVIFVARPFVEDWPRLALILFGCGLPAWIAIRYCRPANKRCLWLCLAGVALPVALWSFCCFGDPPRSQLFSFRAAELRFGSSPLWPILAAAVALLLWCFVHVTRLHFASSQQPDVLTNGVETVLRGRLWKSHEHFSNSAQSALGVGLPGHPLRNRRLRRLWIALLALAGVCCLLRVDVQLGSIDGARYDILCIPLQLLVAALLLLTCWHIHILWKSLHDFTTGLDLLPVAGAFVPASAAGSNRPIWVRHFNFQSLDIHTNSLLILHDMALQPKQFAKYWLTVDDVKLWHAHYLELVNTAIPTGSCPSRAALAARHQDLWRWTERVTGEMWQRIISPASQCEPLAAKWAGEATEKETTGTSSQRRSNTPGDSRSLPDLAAAFVALQFSPFLLYGVRQIQNLLWFPSIGFVLLTLGMTSYNFQAPHMIGRFLMALFAAIACMLGMCMAQMERDPILSRIAGTKPGELSATFYLKLARYGALPLLGLLAWQFPWLSNLLSSWIEPALEALQ